MLLHSSLLQRTRRGKTVSQVSPAEGSGEWGGEVRNGVHPQSSLSVPKHWLFPRQTPQSPGNSCVSWIKDPGASELLVSLSTHALTFSQMIPSVLWSSSMGYSNYLWGPYSLHLATPKPAVLLPVAECHCTSDCCTSHSLLVVLAEHGWWSQLRALVRAKQTHTPLGFVILAIILHLKEASVVMKLTHMFPRGTARSSHLRL